MRTLEEWVESSYTMDQLDRETRGLGKYLVYSVVHGGKYRVYHVVWAVIRRLIRDRYRVIVDPTCGTKNYQFSRILGALREAGYEYRACDLDPANPCGRVCNVFSPESLPKGEVFWYDPPFYDRAKSVDKRGRDYAVDRSRDIDEIRRYYSEEVLQGFEARGARVIVLKGGDFYIGRRMVLFQRDIMTVPDGWFVAGLVIYRYVTSHGPLMNNRLWRSNPYRVHNLHSYYVVLEKEA